MHTILSFLSATNPNTSYTSYQYNENPRWDSTKNVITINIIKNKALTEYPLNLIYVVISFLNYKIDTWQIKRRVTLLYCNLNIYTVITVNGCTVLNK